MKSEHKPNYLTQTKSRKILPDLSILRFSLIESSEPGPRGGRGDSKKKEFFVFLFWTKGGFMVVKVLGKLDYEKYVSGLLVKEVMFYG